MGKFKEVILCTFCYVQLCFTSDPTFQNATVFCKMFDGDSQNFRLVHNQFPNSINETCGGGASKVELTITGRVSTIYENAITDFPNLIGVNFTEVGLEEIQPGAFKNLPKLDSLFIDNNKNLEEIKSGVFYNLPVSELILHNNTISVLHKRAFQNLPNLQMLSLQNNTLRKIQKGVFDNIALWILNLRSNQIDEIEVGAFDYIYPESYKWNIHIYLSNNHMEEINKEVFDIEHLITLDLDNNSISNIHPGDLINLPNLRRLHLSGNRLKVIPNGVFNGSSVENLDLSHNKISAIEGQAFDDMEHLLELKINHNRLKIWNGDWFAGSWSSGFSRYRKLDVSYNNIEEIPGNAFKNYGNNNFIIQLQWNRIRKISDGAFNGLRSVHLLDLSHNGISEWNENLLKRVNVIGTVDLSDNEFRCSDIDSNSVIVPRARRVVLYDCVQFDKE